VGGQYPGGERIEITVLALSDTVPVAVRLRRLLKHALRACRFRCLRVIDVPVDTQAIREGDRPAESK
jgi:hypothetical protein